MTEAKKRGRPREHGTGKGTPPTQFRFAPEVLADLDFLRGRYGLASRADVMRLLIRRAAREERRKN